MNQSPRVPQFLLIQLATFVERPPWILVYRLERSKNGRSREKRNCGCCTWISTYVWHCPPTVEGFFTWQHMFSAKCIKCVRMCRTLGRVSKDRWLTRLIHYPPGIIITFTYTIPLVRLTHPVRTPPQRNIYFSNNDWNWVCQIQVSGSAF